MPSRFSIHGPRPPPKPAEEVPIDRDAAAASKVTDFANLGGGGSGDGGCAGAGGVTGLIDTRGPEGRGMGATGDGGAGAAHDENVVGVSPADGSAPTGAMAWSGSGTGGFEGGTREDGGNGGGSSEKNGPREPRVAVGDRASVVVQWPVILLIHSYEHGRKDMSMMCRPP